MREWLSNDLVEGKFIPQWHRNITDAKEWRIELPLFWEALASLLDRVFPGTCNVFNPFDLRDHVTEELLYPHLEKSHGLSLGKCKKLRLDELVRLLQQDVEGGRDRDLDDEGPPDELLAEPPDPDEPISPARLADRLGIPKDDEKKRDRARAEVASVGTDEGEQPKDSSDADSGGQDQLADLLETIKAALLDETSSKVIQIVSDKSKTAEQRCLAICGIDVRYWAKDSEFWAKLCGVKGQAIRKTDFWNVDRPKAHEEVRSAFSGSHSKEKLANTDMAQMFNWYKEGGSKEG